MLARPLEPAQTMLSMQAMRSRRPLVALSALAFALCAVWTSEAHAYERQWHVGVGLDYALFLPSTDKLLSGPRPGLGPSLHLTYGLNDTFNLLAEIDGSYSPHAQTPVTIGGASLGATYIFDVLRWVPYAGLAIGAK